MHAEYLILGGGLAGLSSSYHLGHERCVILEKESAPFGHVSTEIRDGFTWDRGPHVSFTSNPYVKQLFADSVGGAFREFEVQISNYFDGHWVDHPAQCNLYQVPEPLRSRCLRDFALANQSATGTADTDMTYEDWLRLAFGRTFSETFPEAYTRKYWTVPAVELGTDWVGNRVHRPEAEDVLAGAQGPVAREPNYISTVRYPQEGGFQAFAESLGHDATVMFEDAVTSVDLESKRVCTASGRQVTYEKLISTLPLPRFASLCVQADDGLRSAVGNLLVTKALLVNVAVPHESLRPGTWFYVYDEDKLATRVSRTEELSPNNVREGWSAMQAEVYHSRMAPLQTSADVACEAVIEELEEMGLIDMDRIGGRSAIEASTRQIDWANVVFTRTTSSCLEQIWSFFETYGLSRESDDTAPMTDWTRTPEMHQLGDIAFAGRFGQWKYFWTDDCVLRGQAIANMAYSAG